FFEGSRAKQRYTSPSGNKVSLSGQIGTRADSLPQGHRARRWRNRPVTGLWPASQRQPGGRQATLVPEPQATPIAPSRSKSLPALKGKARRHSETLSLSGQDSAGLDVSLRKPSPGGSLGLSGRGFVR